MSFLSLFIVTFFTKGYSSLVLEDVTLLSYVQFIVFVFTGVTPF